MAFKRTQSPTFTAKVEVNIVNEKGGYDKSDFVATFKRPTTEERKALGELTYEELVRKQMVNWNMQDEETKELVPFSAEELDAALTIWPTPLATATAFWETVNGARAKN